MPIQLKIGRHTYKVTEVDRFLDNGSCVQLLTQSEEKSTWGKRPNPVLSKAAIKQLSEAQQVEYPYRSLLTHSSGEIRHFGIKEATK